MEKSKNSELYTQKNTSVEGNPEGFSNKIKFPLWLYPKTMEEVNYRFESDNCGSRSEFIEKAINFYIGYLKQEKNVNYLSPRITSSVEAVINGSEQRINQIFSKSLWNLENSLTLLPLRMRLTKILFTNFIPCALTRCGISTGL